MARRRPVTIEGSLAVVTGAGSGIGRATAEELSRRGARVVAIDIDELSAKETAAGCPGPAPTTAYCADVADGAALEALAVRIIDEHGPVDIVVNNAGVGMSGPFLDITAADWDWIVGVNLKGVVNGCRAFGPGLVQQGRGHVVNVASGLGYMPTATESAYVTTKAGVIALSRCLRADWRAPGVGVSVVCPGVINTPILTRTRFRGRNADPDAVERAQRAFRRGHRPELVARTIVRAVESDRALLTAGWEAGLGWALNRIVPLAVWDAVGRITARAR